MGKLSQPIAEIVTRLEASVGAGKILAGHGLEVCPVESVEAIRDFPMVRILEPEISEEPGLNGMIATPASISVSVTTERSLGLAAHIQAVERLMDALDCNSTGEQELTLNGSILQPLQFTHLDFQATKISFTTYYQVDFVPCQTAKGERRL